MGTWNHRLVSFTDRSDPSNACIQVCEVHYNDNGEPIAFCDANVIGDTTEEIGKVLIRMALAMERPILDSELDFGGAPDWEIDEDNACSGCGAIEGTPEWGTVGDGHDGYCPACADKREEI